MSRIFDALQKAEAARNAAGEPRAPADADARPASRGIWWRGVAVGAVLAFGVMVLPFTYALKGQRPGGMVAVPLGGEAVPADPTVAAPLGGAVVPGAVSLGGEILSADPTVAAPALPAARVPATVPVPATAPAAIAVVDDAATAPSDPGGPPLAVVTAAGAHPAAPAVAASAPPAAERAARDEDPADVPAPARGYWVQLGAFRDRANAERLRATLGSRFGPAVVRRGHAADAPWTVRIGAFPERGAATVARDRLVRAGRPGFVVRD